MEIRGEVLDSSEEEGVGGHVSFRVTDSWTSRKVDEPGSGKVFAT